MKDISCETIRDLIPLYVDHVCSEPSKRLIEDHVKNCSSCRKILADARTSISPARQNPAPGEEKTPQNPFLKVKRRQRIRIAAAVAITIVLTTILWLCIENVGSLNQRVFENSSYTISLNDDPDAWKEIGEFQSNALVFRHEITNSANSAGGCHIRIKNKENLVVDDAYIENGQSISVDLERKEKYSIEIMADQGQYFIQIH